MSRIALSRTGDWKLQFEEAQDIRGYRVLDKLHADTGLTVEDMIVNTDQEMVDAVTLSDGTEYPARDLSIGDGVVYLTTVASGDADGDVDSEVRVYDDGRVVRRVDVEAADYDAHLDAFQTHHASAGGSGSYDEAAPAYRYGYEAAHDDAHRNRPYMDAEDDLRTGYTGAHADRDFDTDRDAVRYGYTRAQRGNR